MNPLKLPENSGIVDAQSVDEIFFMVPSILNVHQTFLEELSKRLETWDSLQKVGDAFVDEVRSLFPFLFFYFFSFTFFISHFSSHYFPVSLSLFSFSHLLFYFNCLLFLQFFLSNWLFIIFIFSHSLSLKLSLTLFLSNLEFFSYYLNLTFSLFFILLIFSRSFFFL